jgi:hypothetical protein
VKPGKNLAAPTQAEKPGPSGIFQQLEKIFNLSMNFARGSPGFFFKKKGE